MARSRVQCPAAGGPVQGHSCFRCDPAVEIVGVSVMLLASGAARVHVHRVEPRTRKLLWFAPIVARWYPSMPNPKIEGLSLCLQKVLVDEEVWEALR